MYLTSAQEGNYNAYFYGNSVGNKTKLITCEIDLSTAVNPRMRLWHAEIPNSISLQNDNLRVYYKTTATGSWSLIQLWSGTSNFNNLTRKIYEFFGLICPKKGANSKVLVMVS